MIHLLGCWVINYCYLCVCSWSDIVIVYYYTGGYYQETSDKTKLFGANKIIIPSICGGTRCHLCYRLCCIFGYLCGLISKDKCCKWLMTRYLLSVFTQVDVLRRVPENVSWGDVYNALRPSANITHSKANFIAHQTINCNSNKLGQDNNVNVNILDRRKIVQNLNCQLSADHHHLGLY